MSLMGLWVDKELFIQLKMSIIVRKSHLVIYRGTGVTYAASSLPKTITRRITMPKNAYE